jgi:uncharacterized protein (DUF1778 family)
MYGYLPYIVNRERPYRRMPMAGRTERLEMRISAEQKEILERAAAATGQPLTGFALSHLLERAREIEERQRTTVLSRRDRKRFLAILESGSAPVPALKAAARRYRGRIG